MKKQLLRTGMLGRGAAFALAAGVIVLAATAGVLACGGGGGNGPSLTEWVAGVGDWFVGTDWNNGVPTATMTARVDNGGEADIAASGAAAKILQLGYAADGNGTVSLSSGGTLSVGAAEYLGMSGAGTFLQFGGTHDLPSGQIDMGQQSTGVGTYFMQAGALNAANGEIVGDNGIGSMLQLDGTNTIGHSGLNLARGAASIGSYELDGGALIVGGTETVGKKGQGAFTQTAGNHTINCGNLLVASATGSLGAFSLLGGALAVNGDETVGDSGLGSFSQMDGSHAIQGSLVVGADDDGNGTFSLLGGSLAVGQCEDIASDGIGLFAQTGGTHTVAKTLYVGGKAESSGLMAVSGGSLVVGNLQIGARGGDGELDISDPAVKIEVQTNVTIGQNATLTAVAGATLQIDCGNFGNKSTDQAAMAGLANLTLIFAGSTSCGSTLEAAGTDLGAVAAGFTNNFALGSLVVGGAKTAKVKLLNARDNDHLTGREAVYVHNVTVAAGSTLNLNGFKLYYDGVLNNQGTITGGTAVLVH